MTARGRDLASDRGRWIAAAVVVGGVGLAVARMAGIAATSSHTQYSDYWPMLDTLLADDGGIRWRGLLEARNEHPIVTAKLLYLLNIAATDGDNHGQAAIVIVLAVLLVGLVALLARGTPGMGRWARVALVVTTAFVVLAPQGTWSYVKAMSGTAWLSANVFVVAALLAQQRDRRVLTPALGVLACLSYGTGLAVWPALAVAGALHHGRRWQRQWPVWAAGAITFGVYLRWYFAERSGVGAPVESNPVDIARTGARLVVGSLASGWAGTGVGLLVAVAAGVALWGSRDRLAAAAPWVGMVCFGSAAALLIGRSRSSGMSVGPEAFASGLASRYWTIVAWAWIGLAGLLVVALRDRAWRAAVPVVLLAVVLTGGRDVPRSLHGATERQDLVAVGMHLGLADGNRIGGGFADLPVITERLQEIGHQPFDGSFTMGCGLLGETVEVEPRLPEGVTGSVANQPLARTTDVLHFRGHVTTPDGHVECIVVVDGAGRVVGTGPVHAWGDPRRVTVRAIAPAQFLLTVAVRLEPGDPLYAVPVEQP